MNLRPTEIDTIEQQQTEKIETEVRDDDRIRKHTGVRNIIEVSFWGGTTERTFHYCWRVKSSFKLVLNRFEWNLAATY
jgi:hypothetical protein